jgi:diguanylate cyclase (GGDEF)-like protein
MVIVANELTLATQPDSGVTPLLTLHFISAGVLLTLLTYFYESSRQVALIAVEDKNRELQVANQKLAALSTSDGLTGIANRRRFDEVAGVEWARSARSGQPLALLLMDVDQFKSYNDSYGHPAGDEALKQVAQVLRNFSRRPGDLAARYGGEEFVVIAAETNIQLALAIAESIRAGVEALAQVHQHSQHGVLTVSIGVAVSTPGQTANLEALLNMADTALYTAKNAGRNRVEWSVSGSETLTPARAC